MTDLLLDAPWWLASLVAVVGVVVFISGNRRLDSTGRNAGLGLIGLAVVLILLRLLVDTPKKIALRESRQLAASAEAGDWKTFRSLLAPDANLRVLSSRMIYNDADQVTAAAQAGAESFHLRAVHIQSALAEQTGPLASVTLQLLTEQEQAGVPVLQSSWLFEFKRTNQGWRIGQIRALKIGDLTTEQVERELPRTPSP